MSAVTTVVLTGGAGRVASGIREPLLASGHSLVLLDRRRPDVEPGPRERAVEAELTDHATMVAAMAGADLVVHLAGIATEASWDEIVEVNVGGTLRVLQAAQQAGVRRVLLCSSVHAAGYLQLGEAPSAGTDIRPDSYYGVGKVALEALGQLFADRFAMSVVSARLASFGQAPANARALALWCSPHDMARLVAAAARVDRPGHQVVWAVSANSRGVLDLAPGRAIGFEPRDDAEDFAIRFDRADIERELAGSALLAGGYVDRPLGRGRAHQRGSR